MKFSDFLLDILSAIDAVTAGDTRFSVSCKTLELFEIARVEEDNAIIHKAGEYVETIEMEYSTTVTMPKEDTADYTIRDLLRKDLREWCGRVFANKSTVTKQEIILNSGEDCLRCEGFVKKINGKWIITNDLQKAQYYGAYKLYVTLEDIDIGHKDLEYLFISDALGHLNSVEVKDRF